MPRADGPVPLNARGQWQSGRRDTYWTLDTDGTSAATSLHERTWTSTDSSLRRTARDLTASGPRRVVHRRRNTEQRRHRSRSPRTSSLLRNLRVGCDTTIRTSSTRHTGSGHSNLADADGAECVEAGLLPSLSHPLPFALSAQVFFVASVSFPASRSQVEQGNSQRWRQRTDPRTDCRPDRTQRPESHFSNCHTPPAKQCVIRWVGGGVVPPSSGSAAGVTNRKKRVSNL